MASEYTLEEKLKIIAESASRAEAAYKLGTSERSIRRLLDAARSQNAYGEFKGSVPTGYSLGNVTRLVSDAGTSLEWQRLYPETEHLATIAEDIAEALKGQVLPLPPAEPPNTQADTDYQTVYIDTDTHLGMLSWRGDAEEDYDINIAARTVKGQFEKLISRTSPSHTALILDLGDNMHTDNNRAETEKSHNRLDTDSRHSKVLMTATQLADWKIQRALQKHDNVIYRRLLGNHDPQSSVAVSMAINMRYSDHNRVRAIFDPSPFFFHEFGSVGLVAHHGHEVPASQLPTVLSAYRPDIWGRTRFRYAWSGHWHKRKRGDINNVIADEFGGCEWEVFGTVAPKDAWTHAKGFSAVRRMTAVDFHIDRGERTRYTETIRPGEYL